MAEATIERDLDVPFTFEQRPNPLPCDLRPAWRVRVLVLILNQCRGAKATCEQLHVLDWAIRTKASQSAFLEFLAEKRTPDQVIVRYDPSLNRAVDFAFAEGLVTHHEDEEGEDEEANKRRAAEPYRVILTERGKDLVRQLWGMSDCFVAEKNFLKSIGKKVTQALVESLFTWGEK